MLLLLCCPILVTIDVDDNVSDSSLLSELVAVSISTCSLLYSPELDWCPLLSSLFSKLSSVGIYSGKIGSKTDMHLLLVILFMHNCFILYDTPN